MKRTIIALAAVALLAGCGSDQVERQVASLATGDSTPASSGATTTTAVSNPQDAALNFAECMREHGIDMPDPVMSDGGGVAIQIGGGADGAPLDSDTMDTANAACEHFMKDAAGTFTPPSPEEQEKMKEDMLAFSKCMRDHGIDMPDPTFDGDGRVSVQIGSAAGTSDGDAPPIDNDDFNAASEACGQGGGGIFISSVGEPGDGPSIGISSGPIASGGNK